MSKTTDNSMVEGSTQRWNQVNWKKAKRYVFHLQKRIYQASKRGDVRTVRKLQKLLTKSWYGKLVAVKKVTQDNRGKKTAGVDGIKFLKDSQRIHLASNLALNGKSQPVRRVYIPKAGTDEKRPLGIPTIKERAKQALAKLALEPEWEAKFEENSYGFRPGRSVQDAIAAIYADIRSVSYYALDADIEKCFDKINHSKLLEKVNTYPAMRSQIKAWLKAGIMDEYNYYKPEAGTPQGGVISPLLANIALHGLSDFLKERFPIRYTNKALANKYGVRAGKNLQTPVLHRYADDFVVFHESKILLEECKAAINEWLGEIGLNLKESKTKIVHTRKNQGVDWGFNYLGFNIKQYEISDELSGRDKKGNPLGFKTLIKPSKEAIRRHVKELGDKVRGMKNARQESLIKELNLKIRGWANFYSTVVSSRIFSKVDNILFMILRRWAFRRSPNKSRKDVVANYWTIDINNRWDFAKGELKLISHKSVNINYRTRLIGSKSPYDGDWAYWCQRYIGYPYASETVKKLMRNQKGKCPLCEMYLTSEDSIEIDHKIPKALGGRKVYSNLQLLHAHCHDEKSSQDRSGNLLVPNDKGLM